MKTKLRIQKALHDLLYEKQFNKISVNDICEQAMISRPTFYKNYCDKYELVSSIFDQLFDSTVLKLESSYDWNAYICEFFEGFTR